MKKIVRIGTMKTGNGRWASIFCSIDFTDGKLSISGVIGPTQSGNALGGCGQIDMEFEHRNPKHNDNRYNNLIKPKDIKFAPDWNKNLWLDFLEYWKLWHLNDMNAGCIHQKAEWDTQEEINLCHFKWSDSFYKMRTAATNGKLTPKEYEEYQNAAALTDKLLFGFNTPKYQKHPDIIEAMKNGWIIADKTETKAAGWVSPKEHPKGLLGKPCDTCDYKYGTAWKKEEVPQEIIDWLFALPETDKTPAWV